MINKFYFNKEMVVSVKPVTTIDFYDHKSPSDNSTYEVTKYINDVNEENPQVLMVSDEDGTHNQHIPMDYIGYQ